MEYKRTLETPRLLLRAMEEDDGELIYRLYSDEEIMRYSPFDLMDREAADRHLHDILREWASPAPRDLEYAAVRREDGAVLGRCHIEFDPDCDTAMVGWHLLREAWGRGYATEVTRAFLAYCFDELGVHRANALCNPDNIASRKVLERCGMHLEAHYVKKCRYVKHGAAFWQDELEYAILREEWEER